MKHLVFASWAPLALALPSLAQTLHVAPGQVVVYDTANGPIAVDTVQIDAGGTLRVVGIFPFRLVAQERVRVEGTLDLSGFNAQAVAVLNVGQIPMPGAVGVASGGNGGTGNPNTTHNSPKGGDGAGHVQAVAVGGEGGESGWNAINPFTPGRRGGGGGGGALAVDQPVDPDPNHPSNLGLIAKKGFDGGAAALGVVHFASRPRGGQPRGVAFLNANPLDDFVGQKLLSTGGVLVGELLAPVAGRGGGAGGNASFGPVYPQVPFDPTGDEVGAGGGGGGGLAIVYSRFIELGPQGLIRANGGNGAEGENTNFLDHVGAGSGGGSGGWIVLQARTIDLSVAQANCIQALGGRGGRGKDHQYGVDGAGGDGGPGVIQLHVANGLASNVLLAPGTSLASRTSPDAHVLVPAQNL
jgi:hypothetical protein